MPDAPIRHASGFRPRVAVGWLGGFAAFGVTMSALYAASGLGLGCPFRAVTGWDCPLCGGTRLGSALLHGDVASAFAFNPVVFVGLVLATLLGALWTVEAIGGPRLRPPAAWSRRLAVVTPNTWLVVALAAGAVYTVARNLL